MSPGKIESHQDKIPEDGERKERRFSREPRKVTQPRGFAKLSEFKQFPEETATELASSFPATIAFNGRQSDAAQHQSTAKHGFPSYSIGDGGACIKNGLPTKSHPLRKPKPKSITGCRSLRADCPRGSPPKSPESRQLGPTCPFKRIDRLTTPKRSSRIRSRRAMARIS